MRRGDSLWQTPCMSFKMPKLEKVTPYPGEHEEALANANGYVYRISGNYGPDDRVPPEAIVGGWKVDAVGRIAGDFISNPNFDPASPAANRE